MLASDQELLELAEQATPGGTPNGPLNGGDYGNPIPSQPGAGPGAMGLDLTGLAPTPEPAPIDPTITQAPALETEPVKQVEAPPAALEALETVGKNTTPPADTFQAPQLRTGKPTMGNAAQALDQSTQAGFDQAKAQADVGTAKAQEREANAQVLDKTAGQARQNLSELEIKQVAHEEGRKKAQEIAARAEQEYRDFKIHDYWENKTTGERLKSNIFVGLGAAGEALSGVGGNPALEKLKMLIDNDFKSQTAKLGKLEHFAKMKADGVTNLEAGYRAELATMQIKQGMATDAVAAEAKAQALRNGATVDQAENNVIVQGLKQKALQDRADGQQKLAQAQASLAMSGAHLAIARRSADRQDAAAERAADAAARGPAPTEGQQKYAVYGGAIQDAIKQVGDASALTPDVMAKYQRNQLGAEAADSKASKGLIDGAIVGAGRFLGAVPKSKFDGIPADAQIALQQIEAAKEALARVHSGGAIPTPEDRAFADLWAPKTGDSPALIAQKLRQMDTEAKRLIVLSGNAGKMTAGITNADPKAAPSPAKAPSPSYPADVLAAARAALKPGSGATDTQRTNARKVIDSTRN